MGKHKYVSEDKPCFLLIESRLKFGTQSVKFLIFARIRRKGTGRRVIYSIILFCESRIEEILSYYKRVSGKISQNSDGRVVEEHLKWSI